ncbi:MAG TPA: hypothetical protein VIX81_09325 [Gammaproteobacteria bacterium]
MSASSGPIADFTDAETWALRERDGREAAPRRHREERMVADT